MLARRERESLNDTCSGCTGSVSAPRRGGLASRGGAQRGRWRDAREQVDPGDAYWRSRGRRGGRGRRRCRRSTLRRRRALRPGDRRRWGHRQWGCRRWGCRRGCRRRGCRRRGSRRRGSRRRRCRRRGSRRRRRALRCCPYSIPADSPAQFTHGCPSNLADARRRELEHFRDRYTLKAEDLRRDHDRGISGRQ